MAGVTQSLQADSETVPSLRGSLAARLDFPTRRGRFVELRPLSRRDYPYLYRLSTDPRTGYRWRFRGIVPREDRFEDLLWEGVLAQFLLVRPKSQKPIGLASAYAASLQHGHTNVGVVLDTQSLQTGAGVEAMWLFAKYCFAAWPLRKLYMEVPEFNLKQFKHAVGRYLHEEACLKADDYCAGRLWDTYILALYPEDIEKFAQDMPRLTSIGCSESRNERSGMEVARVQS